MQFGLSNGIHDDGKRSHGVERANSDVQRHPLTLQGSFIVWGCVANCLEAFANLGSSGWVLLASGFPWPVAKAAKLYLAFPSILPPTQTATMPLFSKVLILQRITPS